MCGIGAWQIVDREIDPAKLATILLRRLSVRGRDAAGLAWHQGDGDKPETYINKADVSGAQFGRFIDKQTGETGICHTRWATQGDPAYNVNNHPIDVEGIVGVHNGHVSNDDQLIAMCKGYKRKGKVDSEAAFAMIAHGPRELGFFGRLQQIKGSAALMWINAYGPNRFLHAVRLNGSPLVFGHTAKGSVILASTKEILSATAAEIGVTFEYTHEFEEGEYMRFKDGRLVQHANIPRPKSLWKAPDYSKPSLF